MDQDTIYCVECGHEIPPEGVYLADPRRRPDARPERCADTACVAE